MGICERVVSPRPEALVEEHRAEEAESEFKYARFEARRC